MEKDSDQGISIAFLVQSLDLSVRLMASGKIGRREERKDGSGGKLCKSYEAGLIAQYLTYINYS